MCNLPSSQGVAHSAYGNTGFYRTRCTRAVVVFGLMRYKPPSAYLPQTVQYVHVHVHVRILYLIASCWWVCSVQYSGTQRTDICSAYLPQTVYMYMYMYVFCISLPVAGGCVQSSIQEPKEQTSAEFLHDCTSTGKTFLCVSHLPTPSLYFLFYLLLYIYIICI